MRTQHPILQCELPVFFATTEGQTRRIAERLALGLRGQGFDSRAIDMASADAGTLDWTRVRTAVVGASIHMQRHQRAARAFVDRHAAELQRIPSAFFSVSLSAASHNLEEVNAAQAIADAFPAAHDWRPAIVASLAGRLAYTRYGVFTRFLMKKIARKEGAPTDTSQDYELTNWDDVDALAQKVGDLVRKGGSGRGTEATGVEDAVAEEKVRSVPDATAAPAARFAPVH